MSKKPTPKAIKEWLKCPVCGWRTFLFRKRSSDYVCRHCGTVFEVDFKRFTTSII